MFEIHGRCTVCGRALSERNEYGGRPYCDIHLMAFFQDVPPLWRASMLTFGLILLLIVGLAVARQMVPVELSGTFRLILSASIVLVPTLAWFLFLFRATSRTDIELSPLLPTVFVLAALIAAAVTRPFLLDLFDLDTWLGQTTAFNRFIGNILLNGFSHAFVLYAIVRYTVWRTPIFIHRVDGVLFALSAGWGYASTYNLLFTLDQGGVLLLNGNLKLITQMCAYLATSLVIGYFLGRNRFEDLPFYYTSGGLVLAAGLNGLLLYTGSELNQIRLRLDADGFSPWPGLVINLIGLLATFAAIYGLLRRHNALTEARLEQKA